MKIKTKKTTPTRNALIAAAAIIIAATAYGLYAHNAKLWPYSQPNSKVSTTEQKEAKSSSNQTAVKPTNAPPTINKTPVQNEPTDSRSEPNALQASITVANQNDNTLQIRTLIEDVTTIGTCTLTLTSEGRNTVTETVGIHALANSSTCKGFDIDTGKLSVGTWKALIAISIGNRQATLSKDITVN